MLLLVQVDPRRQRPSQLGQVLGGRPRGHHRLAQLPDLPRAGSAGDVAQITSHRGRHLQRGVRGPLGKGQRALQGVVGGSRRRFLTRTVLLAPDLRGGLGDDAIRLGFGHVHSSVGVGQASWSLLVS